MPFILAMAFCTINGPARPPTATLNHAMRNWPESPRIVAQWAMSCGIGPSHLGLLLKTARVCGFRLAPGPVAHAAACLPNRVAVRPALRHRFPLSPPFPLHPPHPGRGCALQVRLWTDAKHSRGLPICPPIFATPGGHSPPAVCITVHAANMDCPPT